jgi:hypothetical protein
LQIGAWLRRPELRSRRRRLRGARRPSFELGAVAFEQRDLPFVESDAELERRTFRIAQFLPFSGEPIVFVGCSVMSIGSTNMFCGCSLGMART